jgi:4-hydroxybenzoate polyprenyltransferase
MRSKLSAPLRPEFEPLADEPVPQSRSALLPWLRLMRLPNVFTAIADVAMGYLFVNGSVAEWRQLACLIAASALLYTAGMVLNDVFDFGVDAKERPFRPLPSGQIALPTARIFGLALLTLGVLGGWLAGYLPGGDTPMPWRSGLMATAIAGAVLLYDGWLKLTPAGPLGMGLCRFLNVLLGMSTGMASPQAVMLGFGPAELLVAAGIGIYIVGITWFARSEASQSRGGVLVAAMAVMTAGVVLLAASSRFVSRLQMPETHYWLLLALLMATVLRRCGAAAADPVPEKVQAAVKHSILSLIWLDAAVAAAAAGPAYGVAIAALLVPAILLGRWVYST